MTTAGGLKMDNFGETSVSTASANACISKDQSLQDGQVDAGVPENWEESKDKKLGTSAS